MAIEHLPEIIQATSTGISIIRSSMWLVDYFARHETIHVKEHLGRTFQQMSKYIEEKNQSEDQGDTWRNDWFSENQVSNNSIPRRLLEKTAKEIINDSEERKSEYIAKFWVNVCRTSNSDIDESTAFAYFETIESLSWRQLCIIRLIVLCKDQEVEIRRLSGEDVEEMPQDKRTQFFSISREYQILMDDRYIEGASVPHDTESYEPFVDFPGSGWLPESTHRLHLLMNLNEIPIEDILRTFSPWNVRSKKSDRTLL